MEIALIIQSLRLNPGTLTETSNLRHLRHRGVEENAERVNRPRLSVETAVPLDAMATAISIVILDIDEV